MSTLEEWIEKHGSVIITSDIEFAVGFVIHNGIRERSVAFKGYKVIHIERVVNVLLVVTREATRDEFIAQMKRADPTVREEDFECHEFYYELKLVVQ